MSAQDTVYVEGLKYILGSEKNFAYVVGYQQGITEANIPSAFYYNGNRYRVMCVQPYAFENCTTLTSFTWEVVDESLLGPNYCYEMAGAICEGAFKGCTHLASFRIGKDCYMYANGSTFQDCVSLKSLYFPSCNHHRSSIGDHMFAGCTNLESVVFEYPYFPDYSNNWIGAYAFAGCVNLHQINLSELDHISTHVFDGCISLENVYGCDDIDKIDSCAFKNCVRLKSLNLPDLQCIGMNAFYNCLDLRVLNVGQYAYDIPYWAFPNCPRLTEINVSEENTTYKSVKGSLYTKSMNELRIALPKSSTHFYIEEGVSRVQAGAFDGCYQLGFLSLPSGLSELDGPLSETVTTIVCNGSTWVSYSSFRWYVDDFDRGNCYLYVPASAWNAYSSRSPWNSFKEIIPMRDANSNGKIDIGDITLLIDMLLADDYQDYPDILIDNDEKLTIDAVTSMISLLMQM